jgi:hypothetical protein
VHTQAFFDDGGEVGEVLGLGPCWEREVRRSWDLAEESSV